MNFKKMKRMLILIIMILASLLPQRANAAAAGTATVEIVCTGLKNGDRALYNVYGPNGKKLYSVAMKGEGTDKSVSRRIIGLTPGLYRVESAGWDWSYDDAPEAVELQATASGTATFNFTATKRSGVPDHFEDGRLNRFRHL